ncbi:MAG: exonuclease [Spirochaetaceae bacterium]|nr:exonuclease [Spirochaetaceae bacterium]
MGNSGITINLGNTSIETTNRNEKGKNLLEFPKEYTVIDIETTGLSPQYDSIIELSALKVNDNNITDSFSELVNPGFKIDSFITELTGITNEMLKTANKIDKVLPKFIDFIGTSHLVGHNINFDINFIYDACISVLKKPLKNNFTDTMRISRRFLKELSHHRLSDVASFYNVSYEGAHRALNDCKITKECFTKLQENILKEYKSIDEFIKLSSTKGNCSCKISDIVSTKEEFDESHPLFGKYCVFTGTLEKMVRKDAMQIVVDCGGFVESSVTSKTNYLILGNNDYCSTIKDGKSSKQKKAEALKLNGNDIEIIPETVFYDLISDSLKNNQ